MASRRARRSGGEREDYVPQHTKVLHVVVRRCREPQPEALRRHRVAGGGAGCEGRHGAGDGNLEASEAGHAKGKAAVGQKV